MATTAADATGAPTEIEPPSPIALLSIALAGCAAAAIAVALAFTSDLLSQPGLRAALGIWLAPITYIAWSLWLMLSGLVLLVG